MIPAARSIAVTVLALPLLVNCAKQEETTPTTTPPVADAPAKTPATTQTSSVTPAPKPDPAVTSAPATNTRPTPAPPTTRSAQATPVTPKPVVPKPVDVADMSLEQFATVYEPKVDTYSQKVRGYNMALGLLNDEELNLIAERFEASVTTLNEQMGTIRNAVEADDVRDEMSDLVELIDEVDGIDVEFRERLQEIRKRR